MSNTKNSLSIDLNQAIKKIGDDHILCIIGILRDGGLRFNEVQRAISINPTTLTDRLQKLEVEGILSKEKETLDKMSVVYELTEKGKALLPVLDEIDKFAKKYL